MVWLASIILTKSERIKMNFTRSIELLPSILTQISKSTWLFPVSWHWLTHKPSQSSPRSQNPHIGFYWKWTESIITHLDGKTWDFSHSQQPKVSKGLVWECPCFYISEGISSSSTFTSYPLIFVSLVWCAESWYFKSFSTLCHLSEPKGTEAELMVNNTN